VQAGVLLLHNLPKLFVRKNELIFCRAFLSNGGSFLSVEKFCWMASLVPSGFHSWLSVQRKRAMLLLRRHPFKRDYILKIERFKVNSLPDKSCYGGEKKLVLLAKHKDTNTPTMIEPFSSSAAWF